jgi:hypothetical protein
MALTYDQISAITSKKWLPKLYDNIFDSNATLKILKEKSYKKLDGGTSIMVPLNYAAASASGWFAGSETLDTTDNDSITAAEYNWKQIYANITVRRIDEIKNSGDAAILDFVKSKVQIAEKTLADSLGTAIFNLGTDSKAIAGLRHACANTNTVGGIAQSTYSWWNAQKDATTATLSLAALQTQFNAASIDNDKPDFIASTRARYNSYYALLQPQQRFMDSGMAKGGFESLMFNGAPFTVDSKVPASHVFMLNTKYIHLCVHKDEDFRFEPFAKPVNQAVKLAKIYWTGNLGFSNLRLLSMNSTLTA